MDGQAFIKVGRFTYLCVGDEKEVLHALPPELARMVQHAMALSDYQSIEKWKNVQVN